MEMVSPFCRPVRASRVPHFALIRICAFVSTVPLVNFLARPLVVRAAATAKAVAVLAIILYGRKVAVDTTTCTVMSRS